MTALIDRWNAVRIRRWLRNSTALGRNTILAGRPTIYSDGELRIGDYFRLSSRPVASHLVTGPDGILEIGNDVSIGCGAAIAAYQRVEIGEGTKIGPFVIIMDTNFHGSSGDQSIQHDCRPVIIGKGCRIGSRVTINRGAIIGDGAEILAGSVVASTIPPGACAAGARARIIGRAGDTTSRWDSVSAALPELLMSSLGLASPPDIDGTPIPAHLWNDIHVQELCGLIADRFGVELQTSVVLQIGTFAGIATAIKMASRGSAEFPEAL